MPILVDTCGWIEWLIDGELANHYEPYLRAPELLIVPTSLQFELYQWVKREHGEALALEAVALTEQGIVTPLTTSLALHAADLALAHRLSFADAIIYGTARHSGATVVTSDDHFAGLEDVVFLAKGSGL